MPAQILAPHDRDLGGGFIVRRLLPAMQRQAVGPFVFFDEMGPITAGPADNHDVRPHPHIGLATVTYLFVGAIMHRDSTGVVQRIEPGAVNLMSAGRGIVHSERTPDELRGQTRTSHGLQLWVALPDAAQEGEPAFFHVAADRFAERALGGVTVRVLLGRAFELASPVPEVTPAVYVDMRFEAGSGLQMEAMASERAVYSVDRAVILDGEALAPHHLAVIPAGETPLLQAPDGARVVLIGGEPVGPRFIWWNFVSNSRQRIVDAAEDWQAGRFPKVPGETEFIPLPEKRPTA